VKPSVKDRKKFDIDLNYGEVREKQVADMLQNKKIEVKSERDMWQRTGNIAVEYESYGKPSGIKATESDYWFHNLCIGDETYATLVFRTDVLRSIINSLDYTKSVNGGDHNASKMYLLNIQKLFSSDVIKAFRERNKDVKDRETIESSVEKCTKI
jgi:queuine/archaeosine tRNA-ribosyltransferase